MVIASRGKHAGISWVPSNGIDAVSFVTSKRLNKLTILLVPDIDLGVYSRVSISIAHVGREKATHLRYH